MRPYLTVRDGRHGARRRLDRYHFFCHYWLSFPFFLSVVISHVHAFTHTDMSENEKKAKHMARARAKHEKDMNQIADDVEESDVDSNAAPSCSMVRR